jgi:hypothetical protein
MTVSIIATLIDDALRQGRLWLENDEVHVVLPPEAECLLQELRKHKAEVLHECQHRWLQSGIPSAEWFAGDGEVPGKKRPSTPSLEQLRLDAVR